MGAPPVPEMTPAVLIRDSRGADSQYLAVLMRANTQASSFLRFLLVILLTGLDER